jgi:3-oxoacyl-[acyl-carrier protein] reductase
MSRLEGKVALVTGGSRGIGAAIARKLAEDGADVAITYARSGEKARAVVADIEAAGRRGLAIAADNTDAVAIESAVEEAAATLGRLDILVNNAGIFLAEPLERFTLQDFDATIAVNLRAAFVASKAAAHRMDGRRAHHLDRQQSGGACPGTGHERLFGEQGCAGRAEQRPGARPRTARHHG